MMSEFPSEVREFTRESLAWLANFLREKYKLSLREIRRLIREMLDVTV